MLQLREVLLVDILALTEAQYIQMQFGTLIFIVKDTIYNKH